MCGRGKNTGTSKIPFVRWYLRLSVSSNCFNCLHLVPGACEHRTGSCKISCTNRYQTIPSKNETIRQSIVRNSKRVYVSWSIDDDRLAVVVVEMTTRLVARPEDDDDDDEVHEGARDSAVGYHCH